eukprot:TRINITY_DN100_c0_g3_i1.p2 TRINITY_DN100_c0_g3~~TRINITY_DN100_c0_g3_i1.p2  ORF type:complete len:402 (+),score=180.26 TRINITY_DN100_c0_g3_i1:129-1208(+)
MGYWVYSVQAKTTLPNYKNKKMVTQKRYNNFLWLRNQLVSEYPGVIVPPIPEKDIGGTLEKVTGGNDPSNLVAYRSRALRKFLVRVGAHPTLQSSEFLADFLQMSDSDFAKRQKKTSDKTYEIISIPASLKISGAFKSAPTSSEYKKWESTIAYFERFEETLGGMRERLNKIMMNRVEGGRHLAEFGQAMFCVGEIEAAQRGSDGLGEGMKHFGKAVADQQKHATEHANNECVHVAESISYYQGICAAVLVTVRRLMKLFQNREAVHQNFIKAKEARDATPSQPVEAYNKAAAKAAALQDEADTATNTLEALDKDLTGELTRFAAEKSYDFKGILQTFLDLTRGSASEEMKTWEAFVPQ